MADLTGHSLGRYQLTEQLGEGGMATVYKAYDTRLETDVAVKVIRTERLTDENKERALKRFEREAKALARLTHPNIVSVKDYGEHDGNPYLVMPYLPGGTLKQRLGKPIPWQEALRILLPIARALEFAHSQNMIHRDVKPSNILMTMSGDPMLTDFGIAKILDLEQMADLTRTGTWIGTPEYMAPEQWTGKTSTQSDQYALGVVLYEMLTGRRPYTADTPAAIMVKMTNDPLPRPSQYARDLPNKVEEFLLKALAKNPANRYASMGEFASAMESLLAGAAAPEKRQPVRTQQQAIDVQATIDEGLEEPTILATSAPQIRSAQTSSPPISSGLLRYWPIGVIGVLIIVGCSIALILLCSSGGGLSLFPMHTPTVTSVPTQPASPTPKPPQIKFEPYRLGDTAEVLYNLGTENPPGTWVVNISANTPVMILQGWCATTQAILDQNLPMLQIQIFVDGEEVTQSIPLFSSTTDNGWVCHSHRAVVWSWPTGTHTIIYKIIFFQKINDGENDFEGALVDTFTINISP